MKTKPCPRCERSAEWNEAISFYNCSCCSLMWRVSADNQLLDAAFCSEALEVGGLNHDETVRLLQKYLADRMGQKNP